MLLFFDAETSGLPVEGGALAEQPHIVQLAAALTEDDGQVRASMNVIIRPDGWEVSAGAAAVHGLDTETCRHCGTDITVALTLFGDLHDRVSRRVAHNLAFDERMVDLESERTSIDIWEDPIDDQRRVCTMTAAADLVGIPPTDAMMATGRKRPKAPTLEETHQELSSGGASTLPTARSLT